MSSFGWINQGSKDMTFFVDPSLLFRMTGQSLKIQLVTWVGYANNLADGCYLVEGRKILISTFLVPPRKEKAFQ